MYYSLPGSSVNGISQARILEWVAISFSRDHCKDGHGSMEGREKRRKKFLFLSIPKIEEQNSVSQVNSLKTFKDQTIPILFKHLQRIRKQEKLPNSYHTCLVTQLYPTLCDPMDYSLPGSSVNGIFQARILE